jgi:hypothetical protein
MLTTARPARAQHTADVTRSPTYAGGTDLHRRATPTRHLPGTGRHRTAALGPAPSERRTPMKAIVQDTYGKRDVLELQDIDKPVQDTYGSADVQTATGGTR